MNIDDALTAKQKTKLEQLNHFLDQAQLEVAETRDIDYARQVRVTDGLDEAVINVYTSGKVTIGGPKTPLREALESWSNQASAASLARSTREGAAGPARIGVDEAGKGDYFGPLVVAAVYLRPETAGQIAAAGVRDSKSLRDEAIQEMALKIRSCCPNVVRIVQPPEYNALYAEIGNLNRLLAALHAEVIEKLASQTGSKLAISDQFARPELLDREVARRNIPVKLEQRTGGEADLAVAAASILARESFVAAIEDFRIKSELPIPLGSSSPEIVRIGKEIIDRWGQTGLGRIAKVHFKTTAKILAA